MATYKLITSSTFTDNTCSEDPEDLQRYVDNIREDMLSHWDTVEVTCDVDGKVYTSKGEGNQREAMGQSRFANHPWHRLSEELPPEELRVLFHDGADMHMGWISKMTPEGRRITDGGYLVILEDYHDPSYYGIENVVNEWWWRKVEAPAAVNKEG